MPTYDVISNTVVGAVNSVTLSSIPTSTYPNLRLVFTGKESTALGTTNILRARYSTAADHFCLGQSGTGGSAPTYVNVRNATSWYIGTIPGAGMTAEKQGLIVIDFIAANTSKSGFVSNFYWTDTSSSYGSENFAIVSSNLSGFTSLTIFTASSNSFENSTITLYGMS
jgi:hypothetical protein